MEKEVDPEIRTGCEGGFRPQNGEIGIMQKRKRYPAELKARVALQALRGEQTMAELSSRYKIHPNLIANWKKKAQEALVDVWVANC